MDAAQEIKVFISSQDSTCHECGESLGRRAWITLNGENGVFCLSCADIEHLVFLPPGNAALTRRARKQSTLSAVVLKWSRARHHYERQGLLVESEALEKAEKECLADEDQRERRRVREAERRAELDHQFIDQFAEKIKEVFPGCPAGRELIVAEHACLKYSGRVGRSASAKAFDERAIRLAVTAHVRHRETKYDRLLAQGYDRSDARAEVAHEIKDVLSAWEVRH
jgi:hypothetical protein